MQDFLSLIVAGFAIGSLYALVGIGLVLIYKTQDVVNFAHGEILTIGGFVGFTMYVTLGLPYWIAFLAAVLAGGLLGFLVENVAFRRLAHHPHVTLAMVTVGLSFTLRGLVRMPFGGDIYTFPALFGGVPLHFFGAVIAPQNVITIIATLLLCAVLSALFRFTTIGKQMRATQQNISGAQLVGINTRRIFSAAWVLGAAAGAGAGVLAAPVALLYSDMGPSFLLKGFAAAVLGGFGSLPGVVVGGFMVGIIEMLVGRYVSSGLQDISAYLIIIGVLFVRPNGLFGIAAFRRV
jgi:branched-chain amino acid transport system permease protein